MKVIKSKSLKRRWLVTLGLLVAGGFSLDACTADKAVVPNTTLTIDENRATYKLTVQEIMNNNCAFPGCHSANSAQSGVILDTYESTKRSVDTKKVICAMEWKGSCINMPAAAPVPDTLLQYVKAWKAKGYPN
jgi:hypothetical protein